MVKISEETKGKLRFVKAAIGSFLMFAVFNLSSPLQEWILSNPDMDLTWKVYIIGIIGAGIIALGAVVIAIFGTAQSATLEGQMATGQTGIIQQPTSAVQPTMTPEQMQQQVTQQFQTAIDQAAQAAVAKANEEATKMATEAGSPTTVEAGQTATTAQQPKEEPKEEELIEITNT